MSHSGPWTHHTEALDASERQRLADLIPLQAEVLPAAARSSTFAAATCLWSEEARSPDPVLLVQGQAEVVRRPASGRAPVSWWATPGDLLSMRAGERSQVRLTGPGRVVLLEATRLERLAAWQARTAAWAHLEQAAAALGRDPVFRHLEPGELMALVAASAVRELAPHTVLHDAGAAVDSVDVVLSGQVLLRAAGGRGTLRFLQPGKVIGSLDWVASRPHITAAIVGARPVRLLRIPRARLDARMAWDAGMRRAVLAGEYGNPTQRRVLLADIDRAAGSGLSAVVLQGSAPGGTGHALLQAVARSAARQFGDRAVLLRLVEDAALEQPPTRERVGAGAVVELARAAASPAELGQKTLDRLGQADLLLLDAGPRPLPEAWSPCIRQCVQLGPLAPTTRPVPASLPPLLVRLVPGGGPPRRGEVRLPRDLVQRLRPQEGGPSSDPVLGSAVDRLCRALTDRRVGLALGGGGALALSTVALIRAIHTAGLPIDLVTGCSGGAVVASFYAAGGLGGTELLLAHSAELERLMMRCFASSRGLGRRIDELLGEQRLEDLELPCFPVAFDVDRVEEHALSSGSIGDAVRASGAFPGTFAPRIVPPRGDRPGRRWLDGGFMSMVPADMAALYGARVVVAASVVAPPRPRPRQPPPRPGRLAGLQRAAAAADIATLSDDIYRTAFTLFAELGEVSGAAQSVPFSALTDRFSPTAWSQGAEIVRAHQSGEGQERVDQAVEALRKALRNTRWRRSDKKLQTDMQTSASVMARWTQVQTGG